MPSGVAWGDLGIAPGRYYVDGILCETHLSKGVTGQGITLSNQPYLAAIGTDPGLPDPEANGRFAFYLDVWTHHVTADEGPTLRESALGGPDTTTRARTVWQVRVVDIAEGQQCSDLHDADWLLMPRGKMTPSLKATPAVTDPCLISTSGGYTRLENQLYRVQIHDLEGGTPRYLWSRENGSVVARLVRIDTTTTTVNWIADKNQIVWKPKETTTTWLKNQLFGPVRRHAAVGAQGGYGQCGAPARPRRAPGRGMARSN